MQQAPEDITGTAPGLNKQPNNRRVLIIAGILLVLVLVLIGGFALYNNNASFLRVFEPSCTVRASGTSATVTLQGWQAPQGCSFFVATGPINTMHFYASPQSPTAPIICAGTWKKGVYLTVRDQDDPLIVGDEICGRLLHVAPTLNSGS